MEEETKKPTYLQEEGAPKGNGQKYPGVIGITKGKMTIQIGPAKA